MRQNRGGSRGFGDLRDMTDQGADMSLQDPFKDITVRPVPQPAGVRIDAAQMPLENGEKTGHGSCSWRTLICGDRTPSTDVVLGVAEFGPGQTLEPHRHAEAEVYFGLSGQGTVTIDGVAQDIGPGIAIYLPPNAEHGVVASEAGLSFVYSFPTSRFSDVNYRFSAAG